jgi:hypothetical protein
MKLTTEQITRLEDLSARTGYPPDVFLAEAIDDWFATCAPSYIDRALKRRGVVLVPLRPSPLEYSL